jgi:hypothetical protein
MTAAVRMARLRERQAAGRVVLQIEVDELGLVDTLVAARLVDRQADPSPAELARAVERLLRLVGAPAQAKF